MLTNLKLEKVLFIDVETVPLSPTYNQLDKRNQQLWDRKAGFLVKEEQTPEEVYERAGIYAEFGKVICISLGIYHEEKGTAKFRLKSFYGNNEKDLLSDFVSLLTERFSSSDYLLCAHNGKEFDLPFLARRILINQLRLPYLLDIAGRKPWEVQHIDTMQLWKFGDYKHYTSLDLLTHVFDIPSPKNDIEGKDVARLYWKEDQLDRIVDYCQKDTIAVAQIMLRYMGKPLVETENITFT